MRGENPQFCSFAARLFFGYTTCMPLFSRISPGTRKFSKFVPPDAPKMHSLSLSLLRFFCKTFSKLLHCGGFLENLSDQIKNLYDNKLVRALKRSELKRSASGTEGITLSSVNYLHRRKS